MGTVTAIRRPPKSAKPANSARAERRKYLTYDEIQALSTGAKQGAFGRRDSTLVLVMYRHGLRCAEAAALRWDQVNFKEGTLYVRRLKGGVDSVHPLAGPEIRALRALQAAGPYVFVSKRQGPLSPRSIHHIIQLAGQRAGFPWPVHPHQLRHACGYYLANRGHDTRAIQVYLGHSNIRHTSKYTELAHDRFKNFWDD